MVFRHSPALEADKKLHQSRDSIRRYSDSKRHIAFKSPPSALKGKSNLQPPFKQCSILPPYLHGWPAQVSHWLCFLPLPSCPLSGKLILGLKNSVAILAGLYAGSNVMGDSLLSVWLHKIHPQSCP